MKSMAEISQEVLKILFKAEQKLKAIKIIAERAMRKCSCIDICFCDTDKNNALVTIRLILEDEK